MLYVDLFKKMNDEMKEALLCGCVLEYMIGPTWRTYDNLMDAMKVTDIRIKVQAAPASLAGKTASVAVDVETKEVASKKKKGIWGE